MEIVEFDQSPRKSMQIQAGQAGGQMKRLFEKEKNLKTWKFALTLARAYSFVILKLFPPISEVH